VEHLRVLAFGPGGLRQLINLLKCQLNATRVAQHEPVGSARVGLAVRWRLVAVAVAQAEQLPVELRQLPRVRPIENHLRHRRVLH